MKKVLLLLCLLLLGSLQFAHAGCGGTQVTIPPVLGIDDGKEYGRIWMNYNTSNDTYCTTMTLRGPRENRPTDGQLSYDICAAGLNSSGTCQGTITRGPSITDRQPFEFGPIRVAGDNRCIRARGALRFAISGGRYRNAFGQTSWKCFR